MVSEKLVTWKSTCKAVKIVTCLFAKQNYQ